MPLATEQGSDPAASTTPMPRVVDVTPHLSARTLAWLADHPQARKLVRSVWDALTELEQAGHHPKPIAALRRVLTQHQPTPAGRCRTCRRFAWRRRRFPCIVWHQIRGELLNCGAYRHYRPSRLDQPVVGSTTARSGK